MEIKVDLNSDLADSLVSAVLLESLDTLHNEVALLEAMEDEHDLEEYEKIDLYDATRFIRLLKKTYEYYNVDGCADKY